MGQPVAVTEKQSSRPGIVRFEANRTLTGMGHERFRSADDAIGPRPAAELARRMFATGRVDALHMYQNVVTADLRKGFTADGLAEIFENLYIYYRPGVVPPSIEELMAANPAPEAAAAAPPSEGAGAVDPNLAKVPPHLLERSQAALEKWRATH